MLERYFGHLFSEGRVDLPSRICTARSDLVVAEDAVAARFTLGASP
jgi:hypothetical protein